MPSMWQYVLSHDNKADLADPDRGREWFTSRKCWSVLRSRNAGLPTVLITGLPWPDEVRGEWQAGLGAFRFYVRLIKHAKTRPPGIGHEEAERVFTEAVGRLRLVVTDERGIVHLEPAVPALSGVTFNKFIAVQVET